MKRVTLLVPIVLAALPALWGAPSWLAEAPLPRAVLLGGEDVPRDRAATGWRGSTEDGGKR